VSVHSIRPDTTQELSMLSMLVDRISRWLPHAAAPQPTPSLEPMREAGWHASSWALAQGADVIELPAALAAAIFPDTQPSFRDTVDEAH
jgi:hypothetical protein